MTQYDLGWNMAWNEKNTKLTEKALEEIERLIDERYNGRYLFSIDEPES